MGHFHCFALSHPEILVLSHLNLNQFYLNYEKVTGLRKTAQYKALQSTLQTSQ